MLVIFYLRKWECLKCKARPNNFMSSFDWFFFSWKRTWLIFFFSKCKLKRVTTLVKLTLLTSLWLTLMVILNVCVLFACLFACCMQMSCNLSCHIALNPQMDRCWLTPTNLATWSHFRIILPQLFAIFRSLYLLNCNSDSTDLCSLIKNFYKVKIHIGLPRSVSDSNG